MSAVADHYTRGDLLERVDRALAEAGLDPDHLAPEQLAPLEDFHTLGRLATTSLAEVAAISGDDRVLDVGSGIGGPARFLAQHFGCEVVGIDLTQELVDVGVELNRRVGLEELVTLVQGNALEMPFDDASFDVTWTQHVTMNIEDKATLYRQMRRVTRPGGRIAFFDIMGGPGGDVLYPVPWADDASVSFLEQPDRVRSWLEDVGYEIREWNDLTGPAVEFFRGVAAGAQAGPPPPLGPHVLIPNMAAKAENLLRSWDEDRLVLIQCVAIAL